MEQTLSHSLSIASGAVAVCVSRARRWVEPERPKYSAPETQRSLAQAVDRVTGPEDPAYLDGRPVDTRELLLHLRACRKDFLRLYLTHMRLTFLKSSREVRQSAAAADAPDMALAAFRQYLRFHGLWLVLRLSLLAPLTGPAWRLAEGLFRRAQPTDRPLAPNEASAPQR
jgi:hypothetical protein